jgi:hypothetical protein
MARALRVDSTRHYRPGAGYALDSAQIRQRRPCGRLLREEFPEELPQHAARDVGGIRVVLPGLHGGAQAPDELASHGVDRPYLGTQAGELRFLDLIDSHDRPPSCGSVS